MKAASSPYAPPPSSDGAIPNKPPRQPHYINNMLDPDSLRRFERALAQQYAREYLSKHNPDESSSHVFRPRYVLLDCASLSSSHTASQFHVHRMDVCEDPNSQTITAFLELPGLKLNDIEIQLNEGKLTVSGKRPAPDARYPIQELKYGAFQRSIDLPIGIQVGILDLSLFWAWRLTKLVAQRDQLSVSMSNGILILLWPKDPQALPPVRPQISRSTVVDEDPRSTAVGQESPSPAVDEDSRSTVV